jgi:hypothetical protein
MFLGPLHHGLLVLELDLDLVLVHQDVALGVFLAVADVDQLLILPVVGLVLADRLEDLLLVG